MTTVDELKQENERLQERISVLSTAILRVNGSLDINTVLQEVVDSARALTKARFGVITTVDDAGHGTDFVTSGFSLEEHELMAAWSNGPRLFEHLRDRDSPVGLSELPAYARSLGISEDLRSKTMQCRPMRHRGVHVGNFFLADKEEAEEFSAEDEEILLLFASQAAAAIANARTYRRERQARANLETLVDTSPVGVVVFDAATGTPVSVNSEAKRIVEGLRTPGRDLVELLQVFKLRRADGREVGLDQFSISSQLGTGETVRAEEIELVAPDGRSVNTLVNATPIHSADGDVESVVVTLQDLAALRELERLRAEFVELVSHELRTPLTSITGAATTALNSALTLERAELLQFFRIINAQSEHMHGLVSDLLDAGRIDSGTLSVNPETADVAGLVDEARTTFLSAGNTHALSIDLPLDLPPVMADRRRIVQVLNNLFVNASRCSPDHSAIRVGAVLDDVHVTISVSDDGMGIPPELLPFLFRKRSGLGGRVRSRRPEPAGLGLAICKGLVEAHGGRIWAESGGPGLGSRFTFTLPVAEGDAGRSTGFAASRAQSAGRGREPVPVLIVDDDPQTLRFVRDALIDNRFAVAVTGDPTELPSLIRSHKPRLVLLDLLLPGADGIELMEQVPELEDLPVIFISAYGRDETIAKALEAGAADYIVKPFSATELTARVRAALRRHVEATPFLLRDLAVHYDQRQVTLGGRRMELTATEYELLRLLSINAGRVVTYDSILRKVWGSKNATDPKLVRSFVKKLRRKLGDEARRPAYILTEHGVGYRMPTAAG